MELQVVKIVECEKETLFTRGYCNFTQGRSYSLEGVWLTDDDGLKQRVRFHPNPEVSGYSAFIAQNGLQTCQVYFAPPEQLIPLID
ncbi:hypothetical protein AB4254_11415 [Vibrio breoganii]